MIGPRSISGLPAVYFDGLWRVLGYIPSPPEELAKFPKFASNFAMAGPAEWQEIDLAHYNLPIKNQGNSSSCVGQGCSSGCELSWAQSGRPLHGFNAYFLYGLINGGMDQGAMISDAMTALMTTGICSQEALPPGMMFSSQFPQSAFQDAANYKLVKAYHCRSFEEICSAISLGFPTPLGIYVGNNFPQVDAEGVAPLPAGGGGGHCILGCGVKRSSQYGWVIKIQNSWGQNFAQGGYCYLRKEHFARMNPDAFAIQGMGGPDPVTPVVTVV